MQGGKGDVSGWRDHEMGDGLCEEDDGRGRGGLEGGNTLGGGTTRRSATFSSRLFYGVNFKSYLHSNCYC